MQVTFSTRVYADITLFGDVAMSLLKMMGHSTKVPGAILAEDVHGALNRLTAVIAHEKTLPPEENKNAEELEVSMAHRAIPLINLLTAAAKENCNVMWS